MSCVCTTLLDWYKGNCNNISEIKVKDLPLYQQKTPKSIFGSLTFISTWSVKAQHSRAVSMSASSKISGTLKSRRLVFGEWARHFKGLSVTFALQAPLQLIFLCNSGSVRSNAYTRHSEEEYLIHYRNLCVTRWVTIELEKPGADRIMAELVCMRGLFAHSKCLLK